jgi:hypothetical protein
MSWIVAKLGIRGIKGVLDRAGDFELAKKRSPRSVAIYARNACGKSGYADAVEYLFSEDGGVAHLGKGGPDSECGGKHAIPHVLAEEKGIEPQVSMTLVNSESGELIQVTRPVKTGRGDDMPSELYPIVRTAPAHRVLRQHDLRRFIVDLTPGAKYAELSRWLGLTHLEKVLKHLQTTSNALESTDLDREIEERVQDIAKHTNDAVTAYDKRAVLLWCAAEAKQHLNKSFAIRSLEDMDKAVQALKHRRDQIILSSGAAESYQDKLTLDQTATGLVSQNGQLQLCDAALTRAVAAEQQTKRVRAAAKNSVFQEVWDAAKGVLESQVTATCPICLTPWGDTQAGSQKAALLQITRSRSELTKLAVAQAKQQQAIHEFEATTRELEACLSTITTQAQKLSLSEMQTQAAGYVKAVKRLSTTNRPPSEVQSQYKALSNRCRQFVSQRLLPALQGLKITGIPHKATQIDKTIEHFQALRDTFARLEELYHERGEYRKIERSFNAIAEVIQEQTSALVNNVVAALRKDAQSIYQIIHPTGAVPNIHIIPDTESRTLTVRVDFHSPDRTVPPAGYLSESQINTLGLALFINSVGLFNREFPFLFLDDIVSSYDADHRGRIVDVIAERLDEFQVFLTTHDWRFYSMLRDRLQDKGWLFECISGWDFEHGPKREADALRPDRINTLIKEGDASIAGNAVRQYMEDWLDKICARYMAYTIHKRGQKEFDRTLFDFWGPFITRLKEIKGGFFADHIEPQDCYQRLKSHSLLNYYSHAQANPYEWPAIGDVEYVWEEFQQFQGLFRCASCDCLLKFDHNENRFYCTCGGQIFATNVSD